MSQCVGTGLEKALKGYHIKVEHGPDCSLEVWSTKPPCAFLSEVSSEFSL